jgi:hypothetical protein
MIRMLENAKVKLQMKDVSSTVVLGIPEVT